MEVRNDTDKQHTDVWLRSAIRGMRSPYESWKKSDSNSVYDLGIDMDDCPYLGQCFKEDCFYCEHTGIGPNDMDLCKRLIKAGSEHRKFLRMIHVQADITAPRYWWAEADKYKWLEANSSSTMHLITKRELTLDDFSFDRELVIMGQGLTDAIDKINTLIKLNRTHDESDKTLAMVKQLLPESYNQLRTIDTNYECLLSIHHQRHNHRLTEWREFCTWIEQLPYMKEFLEVTG